MFVYIIRHKNGGGMIKISPITYILITIHIYLKHPQKNIKQTQNTPEYNKNITKNNKTLTKNKQKNSPKIPLTQHIVTTLQTHTTYSRKQKCITK